MLEDILLWAYMLNLVFLMMHETDAAYWKEWKFFGRLGASLSDKAGLTVFVLARIPICIPLLYGLVNLERRSGLVISLILSGFLIFHFVLHMLLIRKGHKEFTWPISYFVQAGMLLLSLVQLPITVHFLSQ
ncbi:MAG: DUF6713 family protein [Anaerolineae bacterium]